MLINLLHQESAIVSLQVGVIVLFIVYQYPVFELIHVAKSRYCLDSTVHWFEIDLSHLKYLHCVVTGTASVRGKAETTAVLKVQKYASKSF